jgi:hypothetical protein
MENIDLLRSSATSRTVSRPRADSRASKILNIAGASGRGSLEKSARLTGIFAGADRARFRRGLLEFRMIGSPSGSPREPFRNSAYFLNDCPMTSRRELMTNAHHMPTKERETRLQEESKLTTECNQGKIVEKRAVLWKYWRLWKNCEALG